MEQKAVRVADNTEPHLLKPGEYTKIIAPAFQNYFVVNTPNGYLGSLLKHDVAENANGTITVSPSILVNTSDVKGNLVEAWHGYLINDIWKW